MRVGAGGVAFLGLRGAYLVVQQAPDLMSVPGKGGIRAQVLGRGTRLECDVDDLLDPAGSTGHHRDPLAEVHGLLDTVGEELSRAEMHVSIFYGIIALTERAVTFWHPSYRTR